MAEEKDILLNFNINTEDSVQSIDKLRAANRALTRERNQTNVATEEGRKKVQELNAAIDKNNAVIKDNSAALEKQRLNVGNYTDSITDAAKELKIAGVSVNDFSSKLAAFANPGTAAIGIVTALGAAYAKSSIGAKDLGTAQNQLNAILAITTDRFAGLFSSVEDGEGIITKFLNAYLTVGFYTPVGQALRLFGIDLLDIRDKSKEAAVAIEQLNALNERKSLILAEVSDRQAENIELLTQLTDKTKTLAAREEIVEQARKNIEINKRKQLQLINEEIELIEKQNVGVADRGPIEGQINKLIAEKSRLLKQSDQAEQKFIKTLRAARLEEQKDIEKTNELLAKQEEQKRKLAQEDAETAITYNKVLQRQEQAANQEVEIRTDVLKKIEKVESNSLDKRFEAFKEDAEKRKEQYEQDKINYIQSEQAKLAAASLYLQTGATLAATIFGEQSAAYKALAISQTIIDTYRGATAALAPPPIGAGPLFGPALAALTVASGLANVARISGIAAAGGTDFVTNKPTLLLVGDNPGGRERVTVEPLSGKGKTKTFGGGKGIAMAGGGSLTVGSFNDGGLSTNTSVASVNNNLLLTNAIKRLPNPVVSVKEISKVQRRVSVKQTISKR